MFFDKTRKKIGLALGSGGSRGYAHIGVIRTLLEHNIPIDYLAGASAGALFGGLFAANNDINAVQDFAEGFDYKDFFPLLTDVNVRKGMIKGNKVLEYIRSALGSVTTFADLATPLSIVATDLVSGEPVIFSTGDLATAIRASISLPYLFEPVSLNSTILIDGGASIPVPVDAVRAMGADIVIAVNLDASFFPAKHITSVQQSSKTMIGVLKSTVDLFRYHLAKNICLRADIVVEPKVFETHLIDIIQGKPFIAEGEKAMTLALPALQSLLEK